MHREALDLVPYFEGFGLGFKPFGAYLAYFQGHFEPIWPPGAYFGPNLRVFWAQIRVILGLFGLLGPI